MEVCHRILVVAQTSRTRRICCVLSYLYICMLYVCSDLVNQLLDVGRMVAQTEHRRWKRYSRFLCSVLTYLLIKTREARPGPGNCQDSPAPHRPADFHLRPAPPHPAPLWVGRVRGGSRGMGALADKSPLINENKMRWSLFLRTR